MKEQKQSLTDKEEKLVLGVGEIKARAKLSTNGLCITR